jgi:serine/threonine protein kinase
MEFRDIGNLPAEYIFLDKFEVINGIFKTGGEAYIYHCYDITRNNKEVAFKLYDARNTPRRANDKDEEKRNLLNKLKSLDHPNIIKIHETGFLDDTYFYEVLEFFSGGDLEKNSPLSEKTIIDIIIPQLCEALEYLHGENIIHQDVKPSNILYKNPKRENICLSDYGFADWIKTTFLGDTHQISKSKPHETTPWISAPECYTRHVSFKSDYYSLGISLIYLLTGKWPIEGLNYHQIYYHKTQTELPLPDNCSDRIKFLIRGLLHNNHNNRWGYNEIQRWLEGSHVPVPAFIELNQFRYDLVKDISAKSFEELGIAMLKHPEAAIKHISNRWILEEVKKHNKHIALQIDTIQENAINIESCLVEIAYTLNPDMPFVLMEGYEAKTPEELALLIDKDPLTWEAGKKQLENGRIQAWLRSTGHKAIVDEWEKTRG